MGLTVCVLFIGQADINITIAYSWGYGLKKKKEHSNITICVLKMSNKKPVLWLSPEKSHACTEGETTWAISWQKNIRFGDGIFWLDFK